MVSKKSWPLSKKAQQKQHLQRPLKAPATPDTQASADNSDAEKLSPAVKKLVAENDIDPATISGSGKNGRLLKEDVVNAIAAAPSTPTAQASSPTPAPAAKPAPGSREERREPMSRLRSTIARRLKEAQDTQANVNHLQRCRSEGGY